MILLKFKLHLSMLILFTILISCARNNEVSNLDLTPVDVLEQLPADIFHDKKKGNSFLGSLFSSNEIPPDKFPGFREIPIQLEVNMFKQYGEGNYEANETITSKTAAVIIKTQKETIYSGAINSNGKLNDRIIIPIHKMEARFELSIHKIHHYTRSYILDNLDDYISIHRIVSMASAPEFQAQSQQGGSASNQVNTVNNYIDSDEDGIPDPFDFYPQDATRSFYNAQPTKNTFVNIAFEDWYPVPRDMDYNDFIVRYQGYEIKDADNKIVEVGALFEPVHYGATFRSEFKLTMKFEGAQATQILKTISPTGAVQTQVGVFSNETSLIIFNSTREALSLLDNPQLTRQRTFFKLVFDTPLDNTKVDRFPFNPYLQVNKTDLSYWVVRRLSGASRQNALGALPLGPSTMIHLPTFATETESYLFNHPNFGQHLHYNYPAALLVPDNWQPPVDTNDIRYAYPQIQNWIDTNGEESKNWYTDPNEARITTPAFYESTYDIEDIQLNIEAIELIQSSGLSLGKTTVTETVDLYEAFTTNNMRLLLVENQLNTGNFPAGDYREIRIHLSREGNSVKLTNFPDRYNLRLIENIDGDYYFSVLGEFTLLGGRVSEVSLEDTNIFDLIKPLQNEWLLTPFTTLNEVISFDTEQNIMLNRLLNRLDDEGEIPDEPSNLDYLLENAEVILDGQTMDIECRYGTSMFGEELIYTYVNFSMNNENMQILKGDINQEDLDENGMFTLEIVGGHLAHVDGLKMPNTLRASHMPTFLENDVGKRYVLFLKKFDDGYGFLRGDIGMLEHE